MSGGRFRSAKSLVASRRNLADLRGCFICEKCGNVIHEMYREQHMREVHGIKEEVILST